MPKKPHPPKPRPKRAKVCHVCVLLRDKLETSQSMRRNVEAERDEAIFQRHEFAEQCMELTEVARLAKHDCLEALVANRSLKRENVNLSADCYVIRKERDEIEAERDRLIVGFNLPVLLSGRK